MIGDIRKFPIPSKIFEVDKKKSGHDKMVSLVDQMMELQKKLFSASVPQVKNALQRQVESTDKQIDQLVYRLYDLTDDQIKIVESGT